MNLPRTPALATDCVVFDPLDACYSFVARMNPALESMHCQEALVKLGETVESACRREVMEETGSEVTEISLVGVYSDIGRDPRGHIVSVAFKAELMKEILPRAGSDARSAHWVDTDDVELTYDHARILADAKTKLRGKHGH